MHADTKRQALPETLPIFPLGGVILLPHGRLPLNIFEPRYLEMTEDALAADRMIGMVQPVGGAAGAQARPDVYAIGCAGRITSFSETDDGRYQITLTGICRFDIDEEIDSARAYRRVVPRFGRFLADMDEQASPRFDRDRLTQALRKYFDYCGLSADWKAISNAPDETLVTSLSMICPFAQAEKQALLEAPDTAARADVMLGLIEMAVFDSEDGDDTPRH